MTKVVHVVNSILDGGIERGIQTLLDKGFYEPFESFHLIELVRGGGVFRNSIETTLNERLITLCEPRTTPPHKLAKIGRTIGLIKSLSCAFGVLKPDSVILSHMNTHYIGRCAALPYPQLKIVTFEHYTRTGNWTKVALRLTGWRSDAVFGDTPNTVMQNRQEYLVKRPVYEIPLIVTEPAVPRGLSDPQTFEILSLGRLSPEKNYSELIRAAVMLLEEGHNIRLTIAGEGPMRKELEDILSSADQKSPHIGISKRINLPGFVSGESAKSNLFAASHIYVQCSTSEGFCIATAEALSAGIPTVSTDVAGIRDYGTHENFRPIEGYEAEAIARTLRSMITSYRDLVVPMSTDAIKTAEQRFSLDAAKPKWRAGQECLLSPRRN